MSAAFTPGPWTVDVHCNVMAQGGLVAFPGIAAGFDQQANARLIAAAPDLLEALRDFVDAHAIPSSVCKERPAYDRAVAAIAKALPVTTKDAA